MTFANRLEKILQELERETFQHLQLRFPHFLASPEYVFLVAQEKADESKKVRSYRSFQTFIDFVKDNNESPFLSGFSVDEISHFDFSAHGGDLKEFLKGKLFIHHGDEFALHLNKFGSFYCRDSHSDDESDKVADNDHYHDTVLRPLHIPDHGSNAVNDAEDSHRSEGEKLVDLYPSLAPVAPVAVLSIPSVPLPIMPSNSNDNGSSSSNGSSSGNGGSSSNGNGNGSSSGNGNGVLRKKELDITGSRRRASVRISKAWNLGSSLAAELKEPEQSHPSGEQGQGTGQGTGTGTGMGTDNHNKSDDEEPSKKASHIPYMLTSLSSRFCLQLSMLLCSNM